MVSFGVIATTTSLIHSSPPNIAEEAFRKRLALR